MKLYSILLGTAILASGTAAHAGDYLSGRSAIYSGDQVLETLNYWSIRTVTAITDDGQFLLEDGQWYSSHHIKRLVSYYDGVQLDDEVLETLNDYAARKVRAISETGYFFLDDGQWYSNHHISSIVDSLGGFETGERVLETLNDYAIRTIRRIADNNRFQLSDGQWYSSNHLHSLYNRATTADGHVIKKGDEVLETLNNFSKRKVKEIVGLNNGMFLLDDGQWYSLRKIHVKVPHINHIYPGDKVLESLGSRSIRTVRETFSNGHFLLNDGSYYHSRYVQKVR